jgi:endonuclease YncB( thermonuclease family)
MKYINKYLLLCIFVFQSIFFFTSDTLNAQDTLVIGEYKVAKVVDGDTFKFEKLDKSTRLLGIDTEETFKDKNAETKSDEVSKDWANIYKTERAKSERPVKTDSPFGYKTWQWTKEMFKDVRMVRLEKEGDSRTIDIYNRYLVYVIGIREDNTEFNYNIECVKQGYSPYFSKYGYSKRFHKEFVDAQKYAQDNKLGIWSGNELCYPDYDERIIWWNRRADAINNFESKYFGTAGYFATYDENDYNKLFDNIEKEVIIFGNMGEIMMNKEPYLVRFSLSSTQHLDLVIYRENFGLVDELKKFDGEYIYVKGIIVPYEGKLEMKLTDIKQIWTEQ